MDTFIVDARRDTQPAIAAGAGLIPEPIDENARLPLAMKFILVTWFLPEGLSFFVAGLRLNLIRVIFLILTSVVFVRFADKIGSGRYVSFGPMFSCRPLRSGCSLARA